MKHDEDKAQPAPVGHVERRVRRPAIRDYSEAELLAELARRRGLREDKKPKRWCDECQHFAASEDAKLTKNPCTKSHAMHFIMPEYAGDYEWGYYRSWCSDWTPNAIYTATPIPATPPTTPSSSPAPQDTLPGDKRP